MTKKGKAARVISDEVRWGIDLAEYMSLSHDDGDYWGDEEDDEEAGPSPEELRRDALYDELDNLAPPEGAEETEIQALTTRKDAVAQALEVEDIGPGDIANAEALMLEAEQEVQAIVQAVATRKEDRRLIAADFDLVKEVQGEIKPHKTRIDAARLKATEALSATITGASNDLARKAVDLLAQTVKACATELSDLGGKDGVDQLCKAFAIDEDSLALLDDAFGTRDEVIKAVKGFGSAEALAKVTAAYGAGPAGAKAMAAVMGAMGGPAALAKAAKDIGGPEKLAALTAKGGLKPSEVKALCDDLGPGFIGALMGSGDDPAAAITLRTEFGGDIAALTDLVKEAGFDTKPKTLAKLLTEGCKGKPGDFKALCQGFATPEDRAALGGIVGKGGLGDAPDALADLFSDGCKGDPATLKAFAKGFDDDGKREGLGRLMAAGGLGGGGKVDKGALGALFQSVAGDKPDLVSEADFAKTRAEALAKLAKGLDGADCTRLKTVLEDGGLGADPKVLGHLLGAGCDKGDPAKVKALLSDMAGDATGLARLGDLLTAGGLGAKDEGGTKTDTDPKALAALLDPGCKGKASDLLALAKGLDANDRKGVKALLSKGLGKAPAALGEVLNTGCKGDPKTFKSFIAAFDADDKREGLGRMLEAGGMKGGAKVDAKTLGALFTHVAGEKPTGVSDEDFAKTRAASLANLSKALDAGDCAKLKTTLEDGGLGTDPDVFGHLIGTGCGAGDGAKVKTLVKELAGDAPGLKGLDDLLKKGGFGTKDDAKAATGTDAKCLGHLLAPGCNGDPKEMLKLAKALNAGNRTALKGVMTKGDLGKHPQVLGKMYQHGCLTDPNGTHTSAKNPQVLKDMIGEFADVDGPRIFKDMLTKSGFTEAGKEDRFASVLRHGFTPKHTAPKVQNGKTLRKLANAFDGNFGDLKTTFEAIEGAPTHMLEADKPNAPNRPGKGLGNLIHSPKFGGNPNGAKKLRADLFVPLKTRSTAPGTGTESGWGGTPKMTNVKDFLMTAASFEHKPITHATVTVGPPNMSMNMSHAAGRHSRKHGKFELNTSPHMGTTLFDCDTDETKIKTMVSTGLQPGNVARANGGAPDRDPSQRPPLKRRTPPLDQYDLDGNFLRLNGTAGTESNRIGVGHTGGVLKVAQFYPMASAKPLQLVNTNDFIALNNALTNNTKAFL